MLEIQSLLSGALGSIIIFGLGVFYENRKEERNRKINSRSYVSCNQLQGVDISNGVGNALENHSTEKRFRIIITNDYDKLKSKGNKMNFVVIKNIGSNIILDCDIDIKIITKDKHKVEYIRYKIPLVEIQEDIYLCTDLLSINPEQYWVDTISVVYKTLSGEEMEFQSKQHYKTTGIITTNKILYRKNIFETEEISSVDIPACNWIYHSK